MDHMTEDDDKLKSCPFCGGEAEFGEVEDEDDPNFGGHFVACLKCNASTSLVFACGDDPAPLLLEQWNKRHNAEGEPGHDDRTKD